MDAVETKFPPGDTYKFDLIITDNKVYEQPVNTIEVTQFLKRCTCVFMIVATLMARQSRSAGYPCWAYMASFTLWAPRALSGPLTRDPVHQRGEKSTAGCFTAFLDVSPLFAPQRTPLRIYCTRSSPPKCMRVCSCRAIALTR